MSGYSKAEQNLHRLYLSNYFIAKSSLELEEILHGKKAKQQEVQQYVFISGLARSGTTALMNKIFNTQEYASLQYSNMPILLSPNLWNKKLKLEKHERAHKDGIIIDGNSPEEFDEYFWKVFLNDSYINDGLLPHEVNKDILQKYKTYVSLICLSKKKNKYISKNNNNILRLSSLRKIEHNRIIILYREPLAHASSLLKLHQSFSATQAEDPFALDYFNYLGHHEFGLGHKPFLLTDTFIAEREAYDSASIDYWLKVWINYYEYLLQQYDRDMLLISFEDLVSNPSEVYQRVGKYLDIETPLIPEGAFKPTVYPEIASNAEILEEARVIYSKLNSLSSSGT